MLKVLIILCVAAATAAAASPKRNPDVERAVKSELVGKTFTTKILVGSYIPCPNAPRNDALKMVDTELALHGQIGYLARMDCFFPGGMFIDSTRYYVQQNSLSGNIPSGTSVWILGVDFKDDRVEVRLSTNNNDSAEGSGKIKYMVGAVYRTWSADELMEVIARGIEIPTYEKLVQLKTEFEALRANLQESESKYNSSGGDTTLKLTNAIALEQVLENLQKNRAEFTAMGKSDPQAGVYSEKLRTLAPEITRLTEEARKARAANLRNQLQAQLSQLSEVQNQVRQKPPSTLAEWQRRSDSLARYSALLDERQKLLDGLQNGNEAPYSEDVKYVSDGRVEIETAQKALEHGREQLELADLTSQYSQLTRKHAQMLDAYSRAFATAKEKAALQDLIVVLGQMVTNRDRAAGLGDKTAAAQLIKCRAEAEKYKRK
jgi:hypothetical protein